MNHNSYHTRMVFLTGMILAFLLWPDHATAQEAIKLEPGKPITRTAKTRDLHTYQLTLNAGQFIRIRAEQTEMNVFLTLISPDNKSVLASNFNNSFGPESLCWAVTSSGVYRLTARLIAIATHTAPTPNNSDPHATFEGTYQVSVDVKEAASPQDQQRSAAEGFLREVDLLARQQGSSLAQKIEKYQQALQRWRALEDRAWESITLSQMGNEYFLARQSDQAIDSYSQALRLRQESPDPAEQVSLLNLLGFAHRA